MLGLTGAVMVIVASSFIWGAPGFWLALGCVLIIASYED